MKDINQYSKLFDSYDAATGQITGVPILHRHLSDLRGSFVDSQAYEEALRQDDPLIYTVTTVEPSNGTGDLHYGLGVVMPGKIGAEYFLTKGHYHAWREAAEVYIALRGEGRMLLEDETSGQSRMVPLGVGNIVYVPGHTAHRTINTGSEPLVYIGVYPAAAGHDYSSIARRNFHKVILERDGHPVLLDRVDLEPQLYKNIENKKGLTHG